MNTVSATRSRIVLATAGLFALGGPLVGGLVYFLWHVRAGLPKSALEAIVLAVLTLPSFYALLALPSGLAGLALGLRRLRTGEIGGMEIGMAAFLMAAIAGAPLGLWLHDPERPYDGDRLDFALAMALAVFFAVVFAGAISRWLMPAGWTPRQPDAR